ncbi:DEAD/DEAH box helicase [uncultured Parasutterella sp.]|uniref:DEAD/DEAH box helicase n=1 Tax=uncultured Parasutterella sp. TaxID=1263098 RepID=UPI0025B71F4F|nr:DEAD/DEAH box helicase [uncultured Parasutterella sp.]
MREFKPWPYQERMIQFALQHPRCGLFVPMGMGKTSASLAIIDVLKNIFEEGPALVIAPLAVARNSWPSEVSKWADFSHLKVSAILGTTKERIKALHTKADIYVINYDNLTWLDDFLTAHNYRWPFPVVIADESTRLKSFRTRQGAKRAKALARYTNFFRRFIALTGTPSPNGLNDLWGQLWFIDNGERLGKSFSAFHNRWFRPLRVGASAAAVQWVPHEFSQAQIQDAIADVCLSIKAEDYFDLDTPQFVNIEVDLPEDAQKLYDDMEHELFIELSNTTVEAPNAAAKTVKCLQLANGAVYTDELHNWEEVHTAKLDALASIVEEAAGEPLLVAYQFKTDLARILKAFPKARAFDKRPETVAAFNRGEIPMLLVHPASAGHGLSLQDGSSKLVFFSQWWNLEEHLQVIERIGPMRQMQAGHPRVVTVYQILAHGTIDYVALAKKRSKREVQDMLLDYLRNKGDTK